MNQGFTQHAVFSILQHQLPQSLINLFLRLPHSKTQQGVFLPESDRAVEVIYGRLERCVFVKIS